MILVPKFGLGKVSREESEKKPGRSRYLPLTPRLQQLLLSRRPDNFNSENYESLVFYSPQNSAIDDHNFRNRAGKIVLEELGIPYRKPYTTRHTLVSHALEKGMNPVNVAELTGHNVRNLYQHYAGVCTTTKLPDIFSDDSWFPSF